MKTTRSLIVTADDFGIGPATSQGILELALDGRIGAAVLLVTSPYAESAVRSWRQAGSPMELGWHPCLTLDRPVLAPGQVPSLVNAEGTFFPLGQFLARLITGLVARAHIEAELAAQLGRFRELAGYFPDVINSHHHVQVFPPIGAILARLLRRHSPGAYVRRVQEPALSLVKVPGARLKRLTLSLLGRLDARRQRQLGFVGGETLAGITDPPWVADPDFLVRWLVTSPGKVVELTCHPGHRDETLVGRDCSATDGQLERRVRELALLADPRFDEACARAGFARISPNDLRHRPSDRRAA